MVFALLALIALGGSTATGNYVTRPEYQTYNTVTLYVDPTGNDSGTCLAGGTAACATLLGAWSKLPYGRILHAVTINVAAGNYGTTGFTLNHQDIGAAINIVGPSLANFSVATGSATGTLTAINNPSANTTSIPTATDTGNSLTTGDVVDRFLCMTSGTQNGVCRAIVTNSATVMTFASPFPTAPLVGDTYAIRTPAAVLPNLAVAVSSTQSFTVTFTRLEFTTANNTTAGCNVVTNVTQLAFDDSRCVNTHVAALAAGLTSGGARVLTRNSVFVGRDGATFGTGISGRVGSVTTANAFFHGRLSTGLSIDSTNVNSTSSYTAMTDLTNGSAMRIRGVIIGSATANVGPVLRCTTLGTSMGITQDSVSILTGGRQDVSFGSTYIVGCNTGIAFVGNNVGSAYSDRSSLWLTTASTLTCDGVTNCVDVRGGSSVKLPGTLTAIGVTRELYLDGQLTFTFAELNAASPRAIFAVPSRSLIWKE